MDSSGLATYSHRVAIQKGDDIRRSSYRSLRLCYSWSMVLELWFFFNYFRYALGTLLINTLTSRGSSSGLYPLSEDSLLRVRAVENKHPTD